MVSFSLLASNKCSTIGKKAIIISWSYKLPQQHLCDVFLTTLDYLVVSSVFSRDQQPCKFIETKEKVYVEKEFNSHRIGLEQ